MAIQTIPDRLMKTMFAVIFLSILATIAAEAFRYLAANEDLSSLKVVHDADPGADDAAALLMLLSPKSGAEVLAVTSVTGNTGVTNTTYNAWLTLEVANRTDIPVYSGSKHGMVFEVQYDNFFGYDGLGDAFPRTRSFPTVGKHAASELAEIVRKQPGKVSILATGPLTNIALAIHLYPKFLEDVKDLVILGGSYEGRGNKKPGAEFNFVADPEAAALVFSRAPPGKLIKLLPLETVTRTNISSDWRVKVLGSTNSNKVTFLNLAEGKSLPNRSTWYPFDQLAAAVLLEPRIVVDWKDTKIYVETCGEHGRGAVFVDYSSKINNVRIITDVDVQMFKDVLLTLLA